MQSSYKESTMIIEDCEENDNSYKADSSLSSYKNSPLLTQEQAKEYSRNAVQFNYAEGNQVFYKSIYVQSYLSADEQSIWAPVFTNYRIEEFISQGAYGSVFRATCLKNK